MQGSLPLLNGCLLAVSSHGGGKELWLLFLLQVTSPSLGPRQPYCFPKAPLPNAVTLGLGASTCKLRETRGHSFPDATKIPLWEFSFFQGSMPLRVVSVDGTMGDVDLSA